MTVIKVLQQLLRQRFQRSNYMDIVSESELVEKIPTVVIFKYININCINIYGYSSITN